MSSIRTGVYPRALSHSKCSTSVDVDTNGAVVTDQGLCYLYYGGAASVTNGTLTVQFAATGICRFDLTV